MVVVVLLPQTEGGRARPSRRAKGRLSFALDTRNAPARAHSDPARPDRTSWQRASAKPQRRESRKGKLSALGVAAGKEMINGGGRGSVRGGKRAAAASAEAARAWRNTDFNRPRHPWKRRPAKSCLNARAGAGSRGLVVFARPRDGAEERRRQRGRRTICASPLPVAAPRRRSSSYFAAPSRQHRARPDHTTPPLQATSHDPHTHAHTRTRRVTSGLPTDAKSTPLSLFPPLHPLPRLPLFSRPLSPTRPRLSPHRSRCTAPAGGTGPRPLTGARREATAPRNRCRATEQVGWEGAQEEEQEQQEQEEQQDQQQQRTALQRATEQRRQATGRRTAAAWAAGASRR